MTTIFSDKADNLMLRIHSDFKAGLLESQREVIRDREQMIADIESGRQYTLEITAQAFLQTGVVEYDKYNEWRRTYNF